jgi:maltose O-acetyltransferase
MLAGEFYHADDAELEADRRAASEWMLRYNAALGASDAGRRALLRELLAEVGDGAVIRPPFYCDYATISGSGRTCFLISIVWSSMSLP